MKLPVILLALLVPACFHAQAAVGPNLSTTGQKGFTAGGGFGLGWSHDDGKAVYLTATASVVGGDHARALVQEHLSYVDYTLPVPVRVGGRFGALLGRDKFGEEGQVAFGGAIAVLPWHGRSPDSSGHSEKGWTDIGPDLDLYTGLGVEVAVDALPSDGDGQRRQVMATVSLVGDLSLMTAH